MIRKTPLLVLVLPLLAGCLAEDAAPSVDTTALVAQSAEDAGAVDGPAPAAAKEPYTVQSTSAGSEEASVTVFPVEISTNPPKTPYVEEFSGEFQPYECTPTGGGLPLGGFGLASGRQFFDVSEAFAKGDVFSYVVTLTFTNTDSAWGELHPWYQFDGVSDYWTEPTREGRGEVILEFAGQGFIVSDEFFAGVGVDCWYGQASSPIPFTMSVAVTFAEGAVPSQAPVLVSVPAGAERLFVSGLSLDGAAPVTSHFRVFAPDDSLVCECSLLSSDEVSEVALPEAGDYVILVDHTQGGFVAFGLDAPATTPARFLGMRFERFDLAGSNGGAVDATVELDLPSTPLNLWAWVFAPGDVTGAPDVGAGYNVKITLANSRGEVLRSSLVGYLTYHAAVGGTFVTNDWFALPVDGDWEFWQDHHAFDLGIHQATVQAEQMRGTARLFAAFYDRAPAA